MSSESEELRVLIIGAGLSGLTLAQCLRKRGIPFEIFDRDTDISTRPGWAIAVHSIINDLLSSFCSDMPPLRESTDHLSPLKLQPQICFYGRGQRMTVENTPVTPCLRANRLRLRQWLATQIPIQWGKRLIRIKEELNGSIAYFEDGTSARGQVIVGADGVNSAVREHLLGPSLKVLNPVPHGSIWGETTLSGEAFERQLSLAHSAYVLMPEGANYTIWVGLNKVNEDLSGDYYWSIGWEDHDVSKPDYWLKNASKAAKYDHVMKMTESLEPKFREIFQLTSVDRIIPRQTVYQYGEISCLPGGRYVVVGDAAHPMTPFRGEGGMHAIRDALHLAEALDGVDLHDSQDVGSRLKSCQREVLERGNAAARLSRNAGKNNQQANSTIVTWGYVAKPTAEENVLLESCKP